MRQLFWPRATPWFFGGALVVLGGGCSSGPGDTTGTTGGSTATGGALGSPSGGKAGSGGQTSGSGTGGGLAAGGTMTGTGGSFSMGGTTALPSGGSSGAVTSGMGGGAGMVGASGGMPGGGTSATGGAVGAGGATGNAGAPGCASPKMSCSGACVDTMSDAANCGMCNNACPSGRPCQNGMCQCPTGQAACDGACVDVQSDVKNCGMCGNACMPGIPCQSGMCTSGGMCTTDNTSYSGHITYYTLATEMVACHYPTSSLPQYYGAMNTADYKASAVCGACVEITNQQNGMKLNVLIADECPEASNKQWCFSGSHHIDLIKPAYDALHANNNPAITWKFVPCAPSGGMSYYFDKAAKEGYLAVTPMNHRHAITKVEVQDQTGAFVSLTRSMYNMWESTKQLGPGPYTFRVTDIYNHLVQDANIAMKPGQVVTGVAQFSSCN